MNHKLKDFRVALAALLTQAQTLGRSRELALAVTHLQAGRMLLGAVAELLGAPTPYPQADNPASAEIRPPADMPASGTSPAVLPAAPVAAVKTVRVEVQVVISEMIAWRRAKWARVYGNLEEAAYDRALIEIILAKQWLGEQLAVIAGHPVVKPTPMPATPAEIAVACGDATPPTRPETAGAAGEAAPVAEQLAEILRRLGEGQLPGRIAKDLKIPVATVRTVRDQRDQASGKAKG